MNAKENKNLRRPLIALLFGDSKTKYWNDEAKKELAQESADMMLSRDWKPYYEVLKKKKRLGDPEYDSRGMWYDDTGLGVSLRVNFDGTMSVDG